MTEQLKNYNFFISEMSKWAKNVLLKIAENIRNIFQILVFTSKYIKKNIFYHIVFIIFHI